MCQGKGGTHSQNPFPLHPSPYALCFSQYPSCWGSSGGSFISRGLSLGSITNLVFLASFINFFHWKRQHQELLGSPIITFPHIHYVVKTLFMAKIDHLSQHFLLRNMKWSVGSLDFVFSGTIVSFVEESLSSWSMKTP